MQQHDQEPCARLARARGARWYAGTHFPTERASLCHARTGNLRHPPIHMANVQICQYAERGTPSLTVVLPVMRHLKTVDSRCHCQDHEVAPEPRPHHHRQHLRSEIGQARASLRIIRGHRRRSGLTTFPWRKLLPESFHCRTYR